MSYLHDENVKLINEVIDLSQNRTLLTPSIRRDSQYIVIDNIGEAEQLAYNQIYGADKYTWTDIRSHFNSQIWEKIFQHPNSSELQNYIDEILIDLETNILKTLPTPYGEMLDDILEDLSSCIRSRAISGNENRFHEDIFQAYKNGGWPCGWNGKWPTGKMVVFHPN